MEMKGDRKMPSESHALVRLVVGSGGELELVMGKEIWAALKKVVMEQDEAVEAAAVAAGRDPWVRVRLAPAAAVDASNAAMAHNAASSSTVSAMAGSDNSPCPPTS